MDTPTPRSPQDSSAAPHDPAPGAHGVPPHTRPDDAFRFGFFFALGAGVLMLLVFLGWKLLDAAMEIATPFIGAIVLSLLLEPMVRWMQTKATRGNRMVAVAYVFLIFLSLFGAAISYGGPALLVQSQRVIRFFTPVTYTVTRGAGDSGPVLTVADGIAENTFTAKNLINGASYEFVVYSVNADGVKVASPTVTAIPDIESDTHHDSDSATPNVAISPQAPQHLTARAGNGQVRLVWAGPVAGQSGFDRLRGNVDAWLATHRKMGPVHLPKNLDTFIAQYSDQISQSLKLSAGRITEFVVGSLSGLITALLIPIISVFILADLNRLRARIYMLLPDEARIFAQTTAHEIGEVFGKYLRGLIIICSLYGGACLCYLLLVSLWFPGLRGYALLIGVLAGVLYSVPYLGAILTVLMSGIAAFSTGGGVAGTLLAAGGVLALNQIFDYVVMPKVVGETSGIHPLLAMFALFLGGHLFGLFGMLLAVPVAASVQGVLFRLYPQLAAPTPLSLLMPGERPARVDSAPPGTNGTAALLVETSSEGSIVSREAE